MALIACGQPPRRTSAGGQKTHGSMPAAPRGGSVIAGGGRRRRRARSRARPHTRPTNPGTPAAMVRSSPVLDDLPVTRTMGIAVPLRRSAMGVARSVVRSSNPRGFRDSVLAVDGQARGATSGELVTETFEYDGGRQVTVYVPPDRAEAVVFGGDGQLISRWGVVLETADGPSTMIVGVHRLADETLRLHEYSPGFAPQRFAAHERFLIEDVRRWVESRFGIALPAARTAVCGVSASGELALALGLRHPSLFGAVFCASPGAGYQPPAVMPSPLPRAYLVAGTKEPFFLGNATRWASALREAGADVVMTERVGNHGDPFWREEFPLMVRWAFGQ